MHILSAHIEAPVPEKEIKLECIRLEHKNIERNALPVLLNLFLHFFPRLNKCLETINTYKFRNIF